ncbi:hypothetical protein [Acetobacter aceti]|nr:hypothetical protein [Acetobacter aceti]
MIWRFTALVALVCITLPLAGCGKKGTPHPPGPASEIVYPRSYPAPD